MQIIPQSKQDWLRFVVFPFKAYVVIAPLLFFVSAQFPHFRGIPTEADRFLITSLFPCSMILLLLALIFSLVGPKGFALPCIGFCLAGLAVFVYLMRYLIST